MPRRPEPTKHDIRGYLNDRGEWVVPRRRSILFRALWTLFLLTFVFGLAAAAGLIWFLDRVDRAPREWAPYLERRATGHRSIIVETTALATELLVAEDRLDRAGALELPANIGASASRSGAPPVGRLRLIASQAALIDAVNTAVPGDVLQFVPGHYRFTGNQIGLGRPGAENAPIIIRAATLGDTVIEVDQVVLFKVQAPYWRFENLTVRGVCSDATYCEHVFHVVGAARGVVIRNNRLEDMNAQIKINGEEGQFPDGGSIEGNTIIDTKARETDNPITPIDMVAASNWQIANNFIADFARSGDGAATYGAFVKGAGQNNVLKRNVVLCEWRLRGTRSPQVGLSLGGGGTGPMLTRTRDGSGLEQTGGVIRDNLIGFCNDDGVYVNKGNRSVIEHNTLIDTAGIDVRFALSSATVVANMVDGKIGSRDDAILRQEQNEVGPLLGLFVGFHPVRSYFEDPASLDLTWTTRPPATDIGAGRADLCGRKRPDHPMPGAFEDYAACR